MSDAIHGRDDSGSPASPDALELALPDETATQTLGAALAVSLRPGLQIHLQGDLGAGKTTLVRAMLRALGHDGSVKSPTYTLIEPYVVSSLNLYHFDFYRFSTPDEFSDAGLEEYFCGDGVCLVEWPDKAAPYLRIPDLEIRIDHAGAGRLAHLVAGTEGGRTCLNTLRSHLPPSWSPAPSTSAAS